MEQKWRVNSRKTCTVGNPVHNHHSQSHECPVCKALIEENRLVPLYHRGFFAAP